MAALRAVVKLNPRIACPLVSQVRYRRIRGRNPREPHFEKKAILEACKPIIPRRTEPDWEMCDLAKRIDVEREPHPYNRIRANILRNELHEAKLICFMHENASSREDRIKVHNMLFKKNFFLKAYNNETVRLAITGTKFESAMPFTLSRNALVLSPEADVRAFFKLTKKMPQFVLLAGIVHGRFLSREELQWLSTVPNIEYLQGQTCAILASAASRTLQITSHHQTKLSQLLASHANPANPGNESAANDDAPVQSS
ncbi:39S ribosomal protein L10, mitochondrial [Dermacentor silvarum]|uniref:39S ribosomal protein L10, mitochondrial n=1 Tax=Dermacentor silvarum TaxID=543639 RepID=UPI00189A9A86|nr:39S ribosomal protein L10, mitochondrial [Dermacentor silvarum]